MVFYILSVAELAFLSLFFAMNFGSFKGCSAKTIPQLPDVTCVQVQSLLKTQAASQRARDEKWLQTNG